ncbi:protein phosphatase inhibitor IPP2 [Toxoplasma gondii TgCatPRC2]|uniref:Protein phosphatase inhibitor 2, putative n=15 Tax=Toxoplasma gondii TaxID=5811 RepID=B9PGF7_TOXGV|nr:protein phosphatase inhibitor IPP2 [Toxoplasma gondii ME49]EPR64329.1 protein phosphatase inhibitor IPP2 [Toxoplasma gondii GT1]ESS35792.1 protein phosphatase inhibitor IPP2 [Toxoplasma gondii VEG]KAF4641873.1 protein phosphatase inhibitor IPP2 [Toxoplasma gondii]KFG48741.1 protein phosphatase inhibitor IPP2 [Toxoplasma gondii GAB2-2007-GAL-DOM2]KFG51233.1 protein phosphatase inhibitor IPP2 [Toxoplasma gondii p89]KFG55262.1 protein phosphatase inhibitor IPP2 [Toxoplasma gondii FOU]KFG6380|eukprot:XP_002368145.1 protein phosphatase inhibitor IPP2 [Toxoplasma gondii ME49]
MQVIGKDQPNGSSGQPTHSALRRSTHGSPEEHKHLTWDEQAIAEHDLERGTRMKIDEPPTPYHRRGSDAHGDNEKNSPQPGEAVSASALQACLEHLAVNDRGQALNEEELEQKRRHEFELKRKQHYCEFQQVKLMKEIYAEEEDE